MSSILTFLGCQDPNTSLLSQLLIQAVYMFIFKRSAFGQDSFCLLPFTERIANAF